MVMKERQSANPQWDDEEEDPAVDNIIRAFYGELGVGAWRWLKKHWTDQGVLINTQAAKLKLDQNVDSNESVISDGGARKRARSSPSSPSVDQIIIEAMKKHFDAFQYHFDVAFRTLNTEMTLSLERVEEQISNLFERVEGVERKIELVTGKQAGVGKGEKEAEMQAGKGKAGKEAEATHRVSFNPSPSFGRKETEIRDSKQAPKKSTKKSTKQTIVPPRNTRSRAKLPNAK